jgi:co-chaperonin GroES (HSP10)
MLKAVGKRVVVKVIEEVKDEKKLIIEVNEKKYFRASVIAKGSDVDSNLLKDDIVILPPHTGTPIEEKGEKYLVIYEDQILAIVCQ